MRIRPFPRPLPSTAQRAIAVLRGLLVGWLLFTGMWSGPCIGATLRYPNGMLLAEAALLVLLLLPGGRRPRDYPFLWPCLAALGVVLLATLARTWARDVPFEWLSLWILGEPMLRGALIFLALAGQPRGDRLAWGALLAGIGVLAAAVIVQHVTGVTRWYPDLDAGWASGFRPVPDSGAWTTPRAQGLTSYINLTAALLAAALPVWLLPAARGRLSSRWARAAVFAGGLLVAAALWYTGARGPLLAVGAVACLLLAWYSWPWGLSAVAALGLALTAAWPGKGLWALGALGMAALLTVAARAWRLRHVTPLILALALVGGVQAVDVYVLDLPLGWRVAEHGMADRARLRIYRHALTVIAAAPLWGVGDTEAAAQVIRTPYPRPIDLPHTQRNFHNQPLQWAAAQGIPAALALSLLVLGVTGWLWRRGLRLRRERTLTAILALALAGASATFLLTNLPEAHFWRIEGGGFFWSLAAVGAAMVWKAGESSGR
ncbi:MAG TPA: O-antigen ligase family protein [Armatimonadota bacterium]|nr:O-antigen ligase family protein [Armatimonadota bacterium]